MTPGQPANSGSHQDDQRPRRHTEGVVHRRQAGVVEVLYPFVEGLENALLHGGRRAGIGDQGEPGTDQALTRPVVGASGAASGKHDPSAEYERSGDGRQGSEGFGRVIDQPEF